MSLNDLSTPNIYLFKFLGFLISYTLTESESSSTILSNSNKHLFNSVLVISPSKTEFCVHIKYSFSFLWTFATLFSDTSYVIITYMITTKPLKAYTLDRQLSVLRSEERRVGNKDSYYVENNV